MEKSLNKRETHTRETYTQRERDIHRERETYTERKRDTDTNTLAR